MKNGALGTKLAAFSAEFLPTRGRCLSCGRPMDDGKCRVLGHRVIGDAPPAPPGLLPEQQALRGLLLAHPIVTEIVCFDQSHVDAYRKWAAANQIGEARAARP